MFEGLKLGALSLVLSALLPLLWLANCAPAG
jgi:hypothetical protein